MEFKMPAYLFHLERQMCTTAKGLYTIIENSAYGRRSGEAVVTQIKKCC